MTIQSFLHAKANLPLRGYREQYFLGDLSWEFNTFTLLGRKEASKLPILDNFVVATTAFRQPVLFPFKNTSLVPWLIYFLTNQLELQFVWKKNLPKLINSSTRQNKTSKVLTVSDKNNFTQISLYNYLVTECVISTRSRLHAV